MLIVEIVNQVQKSFHLRKVGKMKPHSNITKLIRKVVSLIGYVIMFPILVLTGIFHIAMDKIIDNEDLNIIPNPNPKKTNKTDELDLDEEGNLGGRL